MPNTQKLALGVSSGTFIAFALSGSSAIVFVQNLIASLPSLPF